MSCHVDPYGLQGWAAPGPVFEIGAERICDCGHTEAQHIVGSVHRCLEPGCHCRALRFWAPSPDRRVKS